MKFHEENVAFLDVVFNLFIAMLMLWYISIKFLNPVAQPNSKEAREEFVAQVTWDDGVPYDVDTYVLDPLQRYVYFNAKEQGMMHLERDDRGHAGDKECYEDGTKVEYEANIESVSIRSVIPGEWVVNVHMYAMGDVQGDYNDETGEYSEGDGWYDEEGEWVKSEPCKVTIKLVRISPMVVEVEKEVTLERTGHEITAFRFTLTSDGEIIETNDLERKIATAQNGSSTGPRVKPKKPLIPENGDLFGRRVW